MTLNEKKNKGFSSPSQKRPLRRPNPFRNKKTETKDAICTKYIFNNLLNNRNNNTRLNLVWAIDFTFLNTQLESVPNSKHIMFTIIDHYARKCVYSKVFFLSKGKGTIKSDKIIKCIETAIAIREIEEPILIHSDTGPEFTSKKYYEFVDKHPLLEGSHSLPAHPEENAVCERWFKTFKQKTYKDHTDKGNWIIPEKVKTTQILQTWLNNKIEFLNNEFRTTYNKGLTPNEAEAKRICYTKQEPEILMAPTNHYTQQSIDYKNVKEFNENVRKHISLEEWNRASVDQKIAMNVAISMQGVHQNENILSLNENILSVTQNIRDAVYRLEKKKRPKHKAEILRDPLTKNIYNDIMTSPKPNQTHLITWDRFKLACTLLFYTGMRVGESGRVSEKMIRELIELGYSNLYQPKVNVFRKLIASDPLIEMLKHLKKERLNIFKQEEDLLYPTINTDTTGYIRLINKYLKPYQTKYGLVIKSHSFRVNFVTQTLKYNSPEVARQLIGHRDIRSTLTYNRNKVQPKEAKDLLNKAFSDLPE
jgi:integrase